MKCGKIFVGAYLGDPDGLTILGSDGGDVVLEIGRVRRRIVNVDGNSVNVAASASRQEAVEPASTHGRRGTVRDRWGDKLGLTSERLHVLLPSCSCSGGA